MTIENNEIDIPPTLDEKFFKETLENGLREEIIRIHNVTFTMGSGGGDNYCSNIYRAIIKFTRKSDQSEDISLIIKSMPINEHNTFLISIKAYLREKVVYMDIIPRMEILLKHIKFAPLCYHAVLEPIRTIVFEDLKVSGCILGDRENGLDEEHCRLVLTKLGKFHATSMVLAEKDPQVMRYFSTGMFNSYIIDGAAFDLVFTTNLLHLANYVVPKWPGYDIIAQKLLNISKNIKERCLNVGLPRKGEIKVLNHGDLWVNNFMFIYDKLAPTRPSDVIFVDFQMSFYSSPGIDLNYFLNTSVKLDVLKNKRDQLIRSYHQALETTLDELGYRSIPTYEDIRNEVREKEFYGLMAGIGIFPMIAMDKTSSQDNSLESFSDAEIGKKKRDLMFGSKRFQETMKYNLRRFDEIGVLS